MKRLYKFEHSLGSDRNYYGLFLAKPSEIDGLLGEEIVFARHDPAHGIISEPFNRDMIEQVHLPMIEYEEWLEFELFSDDRESVLGGAEPGDSFGFDPREHVK